MNEHYANEHDPIARVGVLSNTGNPGRVLIREGATGHLFTRHYINTFFGKPDIETKCYESTIAVWETIRQQGRLSKYRDGDSPGEANGIQGKAAKDQQLI